MSRRRVVKLGGSLLLRDDLTRRFPAWIESASLAGITPTETLVVVGGGKLIDAIRAIDRVRPGNPTAIHWMCVDLLTTTTRLVHDWFPHWQLVSTPADFQKSLKQGFGTSVPALVDVSSFYSPDADGGLPTDWDTTSDAIAALLATLVKADELVLLKSCDVDPQASIDELAIAGVVDQAIRRLAAEVTQIRVHRL